MIIYQLVVSLESFVKVWQSVNSFAHEIKINASLIETVSIAMLSVPLKQSINLFLRRF